MRSAVELTSLPPVQVGTRILYVDTCAFLDLVRMPMRGRDPAAEFLAVTQILRAHNILRLTAEIVDKEFADNKEAVRTEVEKHVIGVQESAAEMEGTGNGVEPLEACLGFEREVMIPSSVGERVTDAVTRGCRGDKTIREEVAAELQLRARRRALGAVDLEGVSGEDLE